MPTYGYECTKCRAEFEVSQRITDQPLTEHEGCGGQLRRRIFPVGIVFRGPGFHVNDYAPKGSSTSKTPETTAAKSESTTAKSETAAVETKAD